MSTLLTVLVETGRHGVLSVILKDGAESSMCERLDKEDEEEKKDEINWNKIDPSK